MNNYYHIDRSKTFLCLIPIYMKIHTRPMMSSRGLPYAARAAYHGLVALTTKSVLDQTTPQNHTALAQELAVYSINDQAGIPQLKTTIIKHMLSNKFRLQDFYSIAQLQQYSNLMKTQPHHTGTVNLYTDSRTLNELPTILEYIKRFHSNLEWVIATGDSVASNFPFQQQSNQDFWVMVKGSLEQKNRALALKLFEMGNEETVHYKCVPQDEKSGMDMFKRSTRGTLGYLTYDSNGVVPFTTIAVDLKNYNVNRLYSIEQALKADGLWGYYKKGVLHYMDQFKNIDGTKVHDVRMLHEELQHYLWTELQIDPLFQRSISFIFTKHVEYESSSEKALRFKTKFISLLEEQHTYNLDKRGDFRKVYCAMLRAYRETIDPDILSKIQHLQFKGKVEFNVHFLEEVAHCIKQGF